MTLNSVSSLNFLQGGGAIPRSRIMNTFLKTGLWTGRVLPPCIAAVLVARLVRLTFRSRRVIVLLIWAAFRAMVVRQRSRIAGAVLVMDAPVVRGPLICGGTSTDAVDMAYAQASISATGEVRPRYSIYPQQTSPWYEFEEMEDLTIWGGCSRTVNADLNRLYLGFQTGGSRCVVDTQATGCAGRNGRKEITGTGCKKVGESGLSSGDTLCAHAAVVFQSGIITPGDSSGCLEDVTWSVQRVAIGWLGSQGRGCGTLGNAPMNVNTDGLWTGVTLSWSLSVT